MLIEAAGQLTGKEISLDVRFVENRQEMNALPEAAEYNKKCRN